MIMGWIIYKFGVEGSAANVVVRYNFCKVVQMVTAAVIPYLMFGSAIHSWDWVQRFLPSNQRPLHLSLSTIDRRCTSSSSL